MALSLGLGGGFVCGADSGSPVWDRYQSPFKFNGKVNEMRVNYVDAAGESQKQHHQPEGPVPVDN